MNRFTRLFFTNTFRSSWRTLVMLWKPMAGWTLTVYALFTAILAPVFIAMIHWGVFRGDRLPVGNDELIQWILTPGGFLYLFSILLITLTGVTIRYAGLFQIITDDLRRERVSVTTIAVHIAQRIHILIKLCAITIGLSITALTPFLVGIWIIYQRYLTEYDINYYLTITPPEWYSALIYSGILTLFWGIGLLILIGFSLPALPSYLDGRRSLKEALKESWSLPFNKMLVFIKSVSTAILFWIFIRLTVDATLLYGFSKFSHWLVETGESLRLIAASAGLYLILSFTISAIISFIGFSLISTIITKFYFIYIRGTYSVEAPGIIKLTQKTVKTLRKFSSPKYLAPALFIMVAGSISASVFMTYGPPTDHYNPEVIAHRAIAGGAPENSLAGLEESIAANADYAEIDVQLTSDGTAIVVHDADFMRVAGRTARIANTPYSDVQNIRLRTEKEFADSLLVVPTLREYMLQAKGRLGLMIELKYYGFREDLAEETIRHIRELEMENQVLLMSLSAEAVRQVRRIAPDIPVGYVSAVTAGDLSRVPMDFLAISQQSVTSQMVQNYTNRDQQVYAWTVNSAGNMVSMLEKRISGLITDEPELASAVIDEFLQLTGAERLLLRFGFLIIDPISEDDDLDSTF
ncbi:glycerophosphodiester phosphodiesterase family protein [Rhodohalobacter halophilus]|uniref:glycerophosphodiester phosphodiesterase family protein n=1 Tax=Rhodohalobacter halophilus TaxID=1812810 RepID=UPI00083F59EF|nr:glycerophosphodiester phosphodiesterase family protein [Rhodohalobacter halophilus]